MTDFKKGDVVELKSGGPQMTVTDLGDFGQTGPEDGVVCVWFDKDKKRNDNVFDAATLRKPLSPPMPFSV